jgi:TolB-like protein/DNA-binding winged helix-turn-helix (wHTH) protein/Flp pilus assembly protein TadD
MEVSAKQLYEFGPFRLDPVRRVLMRDKEPVSLTPKALEILLVLVQNNERPLDKNELMRMVWPDTVVEENNLTRNVSTLRRVLGETPSEHNYIVTVPGQGYRFVADVNVLSEAAYDLVLERHTKTEINFEEELSIEPGPLVDRHQQSAGLWTKIRTRPAKILVALSLLTFALATGFYYRWNRGSGDPPQTASAVRSIAVIPFRSVDGTTNEEYLRLGMADAVITRLSNMPGITVMPTSSIFKYTDQNQQPREIGRRLGVDSILEGTIQRAGDNIRVTVQLVNVSDGRSLWADRFDQKWTDIFAVQDTISEQIARALSLTVTPEEKDRLTRRDTSDIEAYQLYLWGRYFWNKSTAEGFEKALDYFQKATAKDPEYALAYAGMADCYNLLSSYYILPQKETYPKAKAAALRALELDDRLAEAHTSLAYVKLNFDWDWAGSESEYKRALDLNPNYATAHQWYAWELMLLGRNGESIAEMQKARELDPFSIAINTDVGLQTYYMRRFDAAIEQYLKTLEMDPRSSHLHLYLASAYVARGKYEDGFAEQQKWIDLSGETANQKAQRSQDLLSLKKAYASMGERGAWRQWIKIVKHDPITGPAGIAGFYALLGEKDRAIELLERSYEQREELLLYLKVDHAWDRLRADPRFESLMQRVGFRS